MKVTIIAAIGKNREIGKDNNLLWHLPADMQFFKESTYWHHVIMGRKNYESIPSKYRPLVDRTNIIVTHNPEYEAPECFVVTSLAEALEIGLGYGEEQTFIIGGAQIYKLALDQNVVDDMLITHVDYDFNDADTYFPEWKKEEWEAQTILDYPRDLANPFAFKIVRYVNIARKNVVEEKIEKENREESSLPGFSAPLTDI
jgi:dihydrofolate reductase